MADLKAESETNSGAEEGIDGARVMVVVSSRGLRVADADAGESCWIVRKSERALMLWRRILAGEEIRMESGDVGMG